MNKDMQGVNNDWNVEYGHASYANNDQNVNNCYTMNRMTLPATKKQNQPYRRK